MNVQMKDMSIDDFMVSKVLDDFIVSCMYYLSYANSGKLDNQLSSLVNSPCMYYQLTIFNFLHECYFSNILLRNIDHLISLSCFSAELG